MTPEEAAVIRAARFWWNSLKPVEWTTADHVRNPTINAHGTVRTQQLARAVGRMVERSQKDGVK